MVLAAYISFVLNATISPIVAMYCARSRPVNAMERSAVTCADAMSGANPHSFCAIVMLMTARVSSLPSARAGMVEAASRAAVIMARFIYWLHAHHSTAAAASRVGV